MCPLADYCMVPVLIGGGQSSQLTYYSHSTEYIASGICVHLQIINIAILIEYIASGICVHLQIIVWFRFNRFGGQSSH